MTTAGIAFFDLTLFCKTKTLGSGFIRFQFRHFLFLSMELFCRSWSDHDGHDPSLKNRGLFRDSVLDQIRDDTAQYLFPMVLERNLAATKEHINLHFIF